MKKKETFQKTFQRISLDAFHRNYSLLIIQIFLKQKGLAKNPNRLENENQFIPRETRGNSLLTQPMSNFSHFKCN